MDDSFKVIAIIAAFSEGDIISAVIGHLAENGISGLRQHAANLEKERNQLSRHASDLELEQNELRQQMANVEGERDEVRRCLADIGQEQADPAG